MRALANKKALALLAAVAAVGFSVVGAKQTNAAFQAAVTINLCAVSGTQTVSTGVTVPIWGFALEPGASCAGLTPTLPGPVLSVNEGDTVTINVTNALPAVAAGANADINHTLRFEIPGVNFTAGLTDAVLGTTVTRSFTATAPGTYLYQSAGDFGRQEAMGLYGALVVNSVAAGQAYDTATSAFDVDPGPLVLSQVDAVFNASPDTYVFYPVDATSGQSVETGCTATNPNRCQHYRATYWLINGTSYPNAGITATAGQKVLLRYVNAGYDNTSMLLLGMHERVLARDANLLNNPFDADAETIPAGGTEDAIATVPGTVAPSTHGFPLFNRNVHVTNGDAATNAPCGPGSSAPSNPCTPNPNYQGGMLTFIHS